MALRNGLAQPLLTGDPAAAQRIADTLQAEFGAGPRGGAGRAGGTGLAGRPVALAGRAGNRHRLASAPRAEAHAAALYLRGQAWPQAAEAMARIDSWRHTPLPLLGMTQAHWRGEGAATWPGRCWPKRRGWRRPGRRHCCRRWPTPASTGSSHVLRSASRPAAASGAAWAWLPAFALVDQPLLTGPLSPTTPPTATAPGQAFTVAMALLRLEHQGQHHEIVVHRARLQARSAPLFGAYMATR